MVINFDACRSEFLSNQVFECVCVRVFPSNLPTRGVDELIEIGIKFAQPLEVPLEKTD